MSPAGDWQLGPLDNPAALLEPWLAAYREALCEPLPFITRSSYDFAKALVTPSAKSRKEPIAAARDKAQAAWLGAEFSPLAGEVFDPCMPWPSASASRLANASSNWPKYWSGPGAAGPGWRRGGRRMNDLNLHDSPFTGRSLIEASAGTGKTWTLTALYARLLLERELSVGQILVVTYTTAATAELSERIRARLAEAAGALRGR